MKKLSGFWWRATKSTLSRHSYIIATTRHFLRPGFHLARLEVGKYSCSFFIFFSFFSTSGHFDCKQQMTLSQWVSRKWRKRRKGERERGRKGERYGGEREEWQKEMAPFCFYGNGSWLSTVWPQFVCLVACFNWSLAALGVQTGCSSPRGRWRAVQRKWLGVVGSCRRRFHRLLRLNEGRRETICRLI